MTSSFSLLVELSDEQWQALRPLFFSERGFYGAAAAAEFDLFREFHARALLQRRQQSVGARAGSGSDQPTTAAATASVVAAPDVAALCIPQRFDARYKVNHALVSSSGTAQDPMNLRSEAQKLRRHNLDEEHLKQLRLLLHLYEDFAQKKRLALLQKIARERKALPVMAAADEVVNALRERQVLLLAGDTGCGKSTQVPQILLKAGYSRIAVCQPRRLAAVALARRVSVETFGEHTDGVGYCVRFDARADAKTRVVFMTEGVLLRQLAADPQLRQFSVVVLDEAHERHITTDLLLGHLQLLLPRRPDLRLVVMSATLNARVFADHFGNAPLISVPGRTFPIETLYVTPDSDVPPGASRAAEGAAEEGAHAQQKMLPSRAHELLSPELYLKVLARIDAQYSKRERGDALVFVSGTEEIRRIMEPLRQYAAKNGRWVVMQLHAALAVEEQEHVFDVAPEGVRKCILCTNIAETSVTIDGVRFVIDSGAVKEMGFDADEQGQSLHQFWVSRASAEQRKGRAGRTGPGVCYRLYAHMEYLALREFTTPELLRAPLEPTLLQLASLKHTDVRSFPFAQPPPPARVESALHELQRMGALDEHERPTPLGMVLSSLPMELQTAKMLVIGALLEISDLMLTLSAALSVSSPLLRLPPEPDGAPHPAIAARQQLYSEVGDPLTLLNVFDAWVEERSAGRDGRRWCRKHGVEEQRMMEVLKLKKQFTKTLRGCRLLTRRELPRDGQSPAAHADPMARLEERSTGARGKGARGKGARGKGARWEALAADDLPKMAADGEGERLLNERMEARARRELRALQEQKERSKRGRRVLQLGEEDGVRTGLVAVAAADDEDELGGDDDAARPPKDVDALVTEMEFALLRPADTMLKASARELSRHDEALLQAVLSIPNQP